MTHSAETAYTTPSYTNPEVTIHLLHAVMTARLDSGLTPQTRQLLVHLLMTSGPDGAVTQSYRELNSVIALRTYTPVSVGGVPLNMRELKAYNFITPGSPHHLYKAARGVSRHEPVGHKVNIENIKNFFFDTPGPVHVALAGAGRVKSYGVVRWSRDSQLKNYPRRTVAIEDLAESILNKTLDPNAVLPSIAELTATAKKRKKCEYEAQRARKLAAEAQKYDHDAINR